MSVRQYIGARYVPRFSDVNGGVWSDVYEYEPLIIVKNGNDYYTSKKSVPVGIQITNTEYWVKTGDYNGAISGLDTRLTTAEASIVDINDKIDYINDKKILLISDSYGVDAYTGGESWITKTINRMPSRSFLRSQTGGAGFGYDGTNPLYFPNVFETLKADDSVGMILILCGANDGNLLYNGTTTDNMIIAGIVAGCGILNTKYPNADIHIGFVGRYRERTRFASYKRARNVYKRACLSNGITYADNFEYVLHDRNSINSTDLVHPTSNGSNLISWYASQYIVKKCIDVILESSESNVGTDNIMLRCIVHNALTTLIMTSSSDTNLMNMSIGGEAAAGDINKTFTYEFSSLICDPVGYRSQAVQGQWIADGQSLFLATEAYILDGKYTCKFTKPSGLYGGTYVSFYHFLPQFMYDSMDC